MSRLEDIRCAEKASHLEMYAANGLYEAGSWLHKPVKTVLELLRHFEGCREFRALDLGCGVGRNGIAAARAFPDCRCQVDCVDILEFAIEKLRENAAHYGVEDRICGIVSDIGTYGIKPGRYDFIMAISALEHTASEAVFVHKLEEIRNGLREKGIACLVVNSNVSERNVATGQPLDPQFEVNLPTGKLLSVLEETFEGWEVVKQTVRHQSYEIPRERGVAMLETDVVTYVVKRDADVQ